MDDILKADNKKAGFAAIVGRPNVGKSTLMNLLIGQKIAITSNKPQTTRNRIQTVYTDERGQVVFLDTPGIHKAKNKLGEYMIKSVNGALKDVDVILWLVEADPYIGPVDRQIGQKLEGINVPIILVVNKIDRVGRDDLLKIVDAYSKLLDFAELVPVSALKGENTGTLLEQVFKYLPYGVPFYDEDTVTDQPMRQIAAEMIREKALKCLDEEIPHGVAVTIEKMDMDKPVVRIDATLICEKESHKGIIIGRQGQMLKKIGSAARYEIERMLERQVNLKLWVKVKKDWRDSDILLKNFGYDGKSLDK
ncbi:MAG: GTPase Era [Lachnospiraceae bacterium]|nr:GTPase Era [Lachnospiraceae bacterium]